MLPSLYGLLQVCTLHTLLQSINWSHRIVHAKNRRTHNSVPAERSPSYFIYDLIDWNLMDRSNEIEERRTPFQPKIAFSFHLRSDRLKSCGLIEWTRRTQNSIPAQDPLLISFTIWSIDILMDRSNEIGERKPPFQLKDPHSHFIYDQIDWNLMLWIDRKKTEERKTPFHRKIPTLFH
jgi:hypothetical protein